MIEQGAVLLTIVAVFFYWAAGKHLAVLWNRPDLWGGADLIAAAIGGVTMLALELVLLSYPEPGAGPDVWLVAVRRAAIFAWAMWLACWMASIWVEVETTIAVPESLEPIDERAKNVHLGWMPFVGGNR